MYKRKTRDVYAIEGYYGEWSVECYEASYHDAKQTLKCYRDNVPNTLFRIKMHREKIEAC